MRNLPFFLASIAVHMGLLALFTLELNIDLVKDLLEKDRIVEVELIKEDIKRPETVSVIEYHTKDTTKEEAINVDKSKSFERKMDPEAYRSKVYVNIADRSALIDRELLKSDNSIRRVERRDEKDIARMVRESENQSPLVKVRILYHEKLYADISLKKPESKLGEAETLEIKQNREAESLNNTFDMNLPQLGTFEHKSHLQQVQPSSVDLDQDYELVRRTIEEKANRFVPIIYKKRLLEKKKRVAQVRMFINDSGYVAGHQLLKSTGLYEMDRSIRAILHLAEPYIPIQRPVDIELIFYE